ncbi:MAG TPA: DUF1080 domain-containing protein [Caulobacterales bacterium]|nr:DUF1080 domain-containing protein [Caulobacterales bacterium]
MRYLALAAALALAACATQSAQQDATPLFNGRNLDGWTVAFAGTAVDPAQSAADIFCVEQGMIHTYCHATPGARQSVAYIQTTRDYGDVVIHLEYRWGDAKYPPRADQPRDSGLIYLIHGAPNPWPSGVENQIQEGDTGDIWISSSRVDTSVNPSTGLYATPEAGGAPVTIGRTGAGAERVRHAQMAEVEGWNSVDVILRGDTLVQVTNGVVTNRGRNLTQWDDARQAWVRLDHGKIAIQAEAAEAWFRNITIRPVRSIDPQ